MTPVETHHRATLALLHRRLDEHFTGLRRSRDEVAPGTPVFALEHGLPTGELALVRSAVSTAVRRGDLPRESWLPFVIDTAELGYEFSGDEYWQTFAFRTPGWSTLGDPARQFVRRQYRRFRDSFGGATPSGAWAEHFSIICWPITHAVLPADLQRHLARLLYDFSRSLTADLLGDPDELGRRLAARAWQASARFQAFAQNTNLLGQVAVALLTGEDDEQSPYLLSSTLTRIVNDLSKETEARRWLTDAKYLARKVRTHGFQPSAGYRNGPDRRQRERSVAIDPLLCVREGADGWSVYVELPDLVSLAERLPEVGQQMARLRPVVDGVARRFGSGQLLFPGRPERLSRWPQPERPLVQLERGSEIANRMLRDHCVLSAGPVWLFRLDRGVGNEVRGKFVRPDHRYLLVASAPPGELPPWASRAPMATQGVEGYLLTVPSEFDGVALAAIKSLGIGAVMDVDVRPVGVVPAAWDGEGFAQWLSGEDAILAIRSNRSVRDCLFSLDDQPAVLSWPTNSNELLVRLSDLAPGKHKVHVSLSSATADAPVAVGTLEITIRPPRMSPSTGTSRDGLMLLPSPASPTLDEVWDGSATVQVLGAPGARVRTSMTLTDRQGRQLVNARSAMLTLPVDGAQWANTFASHFQRHDEIYNAYERADACVFTASSPELGRVALRCERSFTPLRWAFGRDRDGPYASLIDNTDGVAVALTAYAFARPCDGSVLQLDSAQQLRRADGGLVVADAGSTRAATILPPHVRTLEDLRTDMPWLPVIPRTPTDILRIITLAALWGEAALPADPVGAIRRVAVLRAFTQSLTAVIAGSRWSRAEAEYTRRGCGEPRSLCDAIGDVAYQRLLASRLADERAALSAADTAGRVTAFAGALAQHGRPVGVDGIERPLAEFLLRLTTEPGTLASWADADLEALLGRTLDSPLLARAARFVVVTTDTGQDTASIYPGWTWE